VALSVLVIFIVAVQVWNVHVTLTREDWRPDADFWAMLGEKLGHSGGPVLTIAQDYGFRLAYWGWQDIDPWYSTGDLELRALDNRVIDLNQRLLERVAGKKFLVVTQTKQFASQPAIRVYIIRNFPIYARGKGYVIYDLAHPKKAQ
jgi:hypothetical protein